MVYVGPLVGVTPRLNRTEVQCPRAVWAAMIAAVAFGPWRSGKLTDGASGAAYWAASVRHGPSWPLPADASAGISQSFWHDRVCRAIAARGLSPFGATGRISGR